MILTILLFAVFYVLSELLRPKPKNESSRPAHLGDFKFPTATEGRAIPLIWGTVKLEGPNVVWYGNLTQKAITKKVKTGLFSSDEVTTGYRYYVGVQMALCRGTVDSLLRIWVGDKVVYNTPTAPDNDVVISKPLLFGGDERGNGGISGTCRFYGGSQLQAVDPYIQTYQQQGGDTPAYRGTSYVIAKHFYFGNSAQIEPWKLELRRIPNALGLGAVNSGADANPAEVIYEILTNTDWGMGMQPADIDSASFTTAGVTLSGEGNGWSLILDSSIEAVELLREVERQIDGFVYIDRFTGKWTIRLARGGYNVNTLPLFNEANVTDVTNFARGAWEDTSNEIKVDFVDNNNEYNETFAIAQDMANVRTQGAVVLATPSYPGVKNRNCANNLAWRDLRVLSFPLAKATLVLDRTGYSLNPGDVIAWSNTRLGISRMPMRVQKVNYGELTDGKISIDVAQDVFATTTPAFAAPQPTNWLPQVDSLVDVPLTQRVIFEAPKAFVDRALHAPGQQPRVWCGVRNQSDGTVGISINVDLADVGDANQFLLAGKLANTLSPANLTSSIDVVADLDVVTDIQDGLVNSLTGADVGANLRNLILIGDATTGEFAACTGFTLVGTTLTLNNVYRGLLDLPPKTWPANTRVWVLLGGITNSAQAGASGNVRPLPSSTSASLGTGSVAATNVAYTTRYLRPYPPANLKINTNLWPTATQDLSSTATGGDGHGLTVNYDRRDYRTANEVDAVTSEAAGLAPFPTFPADNATQYRAEVRNDPSGANTLLFTTAFNAGGNSIVLARELILRNTAGALPSRLRVTVMTQHTAPGGTVYASRENLVHDFNVTDNQLTGSTNLGVLNPSTASGNYTAPTTGSYTFTIDRNILSSGKVQASKNGGAFVDVIATGATSGTLAGVTAGDLIQVKCTQPGTTDQTVLRIDAPSSAADAYAVLLFT